MSLKYTQEREHIISSGDARTKQGFPRQVYRRFYRTDPKEGGGSGTEVRHQGTHEVDSFDMEQDSEAKKTPFEGIYDLFAIRIILDSEPDPAKEKQECWQVYSDCDGYVPAEPEASALTGFQYRRVMVTSRCTSP